MSMVAYTFVSGLAIPSNQWSFVAVVIEPTKATNSATSPYTFTPVETKKFFRVKVQ